MLERGSKTSTVPVIWATFGIFSARSKWFPVGGDWWPWTKPGYITITRRQSNNQWSGGIEAHPAPKKSECKNPLEKFLPRYFGIQTASSSLIILQTPNYQHGVLLISAGTTEGHFEGKTPLEYHQGGLVLARQFPGSPDTCNPEETSLPWLPMSWSPTLFSGSGPVGLPPLTLTEKNNWKFVISRPTWRSLLPRRPGWTDNILNIFEWLAKVRAAG